MDPMAQVLFNQIFNENGEYIWTSNDGFVVTMLDKGGGSITGVVDGQTVIVDMDNVTTQAEMQLMNQYMPQAQMAFIQHQATVLGNNGYTTAESIAGLGIFTDSDGQPDMQAATIMSQLVAGDISPMDAMMALMGSGGPEEESGPVNVSNSGLQDPLAALDAQVSDLENALSFLEAELSSLREQANTDSNIITGHLNTISNLNSTIQSLNTQAAETAAVHATKVTDLENQVQSKTSQVNTLTQEKLSVENQLASERTSYESQLTQVRGEKDVLQASLDSATTTMAQLQATIDNGDQAVAAMNMSAQAILARLQGLVARANALASS